MLSPGGVERTLCERILFTFNFTEKEIKDEEK